MQFLQGKPNALSPPKLPTITGVIPLDFGPEIAKMDPFSSFKKRYYPG
jgi:hypothetical protein